MYVCTESLTYIITTEKIFLFTLPPANGIELKMSGVSEQMNRRPVLSNDTHVYTHI